MADETALVMPANQRLRVWPAALILLAALAIGALVEWQGRASCQAIVAITTSRAHERTTRLQLERLLSALKDVETGSRGFLLSGRTDYLDPCQAARTAIPGLADEIRRAIPTCCQGQAGASWTICWSAASSWRHG